MKRSRSKSLSQLVIKKDDLVAMWAFLERHAATDKLAIEELLKSNPYISIPRPEISIRSAGSLSTELDDRSVFDNDVIDTQKSVSIDLSYSNFRPIAKTIRIALREGGGMFAESSFSVSGENSAWVDATFVELERLFASFEPQSVWFLRYRDYIRALIAILIGFSFDKILRLLIPANKTPEPTAWLAFVFAHQSTHFIATLILFLFIGIIPAAGITSWLGTLWPSIEFDFGPEHLKLKKNVRTRIAMVVALVLLPLALATVTQLGFGWH